MGKISIIVPVYNNEAYLENCVRSLIAQTYKDIEIILVDDGSTDNSGVLCKQFAEIDDRVIYIYQKNQGVSVARNNGLKNARGEWITFVDSDDWLEQDACERIYYTAIKEQTDVVIWSFYTHFDDCIRESKLFNGTSRNITNEKDELELKTISQYYGGISMGGSISAGCAWGKLYRRRLLVDNNICFIPGIIRAQDTLFSLEAFELASKIVFIDEYLYHYRKSSSGITSGTKYIKNCWIPFGMLLDEYNSFIERYNKGEAFREALNLRIIQVLMWHFKHKYFNPENKESFWSKRKQIINLINSEPYKTALEQVNISTLAKSLKLMVIMLRCRTIGLYRIAYGAIELRNTAK